MNNRTRLILEAAIEGFIKTGDPVTSTFLYDRYDFGIKPAMIRWELNDLCHSGYLFQAHTSSGRLPTNKAYRFFVDHILREVHVQTEKAEPVPMPKERDKEQLVEELAKKLKILNICYDPEENRLYESGLRCLCESLDDATKEDVLEVMRDVEELDERLSYDRSWWEGEENWPKVFIGRSPVTESQHLSVIAERLVEDGEPLLLLAIGPKRMDYRRLINFFGNFENQYKEKVTE